jgi:hypothetical protein
MSRWAFMMWPVVVIRVGPGVRSVRAGPAALSAHAHRLVLAEASDVPRQHRKLVIVTEVP